MIITNLDKCISEQEKGCNKKCMELCPTNAIKMIGGTAISCITCGKCAEVCPTNAILENEYGGYYVDRKKCVGCAICEKNCPIGIIKMVDENKEHPLKSKTEKDRKSNVLGNKSAVSSEKYPTGMCVMCGLCTKACDNARIYFNPKELRTSKNEMLAKRYATIYKVLNANLNTNLKPDKLENLNTLNNSKKSKIEVKSKKSISKDELSDEQRYSIIIDSEKCINCNRCIYECPTNAIELLENLTNNECINSNSMLFNPLNSKLNPKIEKSKVKLCTECNLCEEVCPTTPKSIYKGRIRDGCILCTSCVQVCPRNVLDVENFKIVNKGKLADNTSIDEDTNNKNNYEPKVYCINCGACVNVCPNNALLYKDGRILYNKNNCTLCMECVKACPQGIRRVINKDSEDLKSKLIGNCVLCEKCITKCPEDAIEIVKREIPFEVIDKSCIGCGTCAEICPNDSLTILINNLSLEDNTASDFKVLFDESCISCQKCGMYCPRDVLPNITGIKKTVDKEYSYIHTEYDYCVSCGLCNKICPNDCIDYGAIDTEKCELCSACANICPTNAIKTFRTWK
ncbi:4Fe-4S binding protein [Methanococcus voltae]|uniref:4Fe-4S ferredoxin iron-sulfur binding domain protein n=1 Tax=Methanococcus voltae (strain ATCC BAA-1334 / A3) TaxID=456320 RepID=D7DUU1_METV3|nr:4Fe-4S binding protein [Methanococcus voltae]MCS3900703.1 energy-converting hydrogenase B subunit K [Methanococcus voltae]